MCICSLQLVTISQLKTSELFTDINSSAVNQAVDLIDVFYSIGSHLVYCVFVSWQMINYAQFFHFGGKFILIRNVNKNKLSLMKYQLMSIQKIPIDSVQMSTLLLDWRYQSLKMHVARGHVCSSRECGLWIRIPAASTIACITSNEWLSNLAVLLSSL